jgi:hypothetical protein
MIQSEAVAGLDHHLDRHEIVTILRSITPVSRNMLCDLCPAAIPFIMRNAVGSYHTLRYLYRCRILTLCIQAQH